MHISSLKKESESKSSSLYIGIIFFHIFHPVVDICNKK